MLRMLPDGFPDSHMALTPCRSISAKAYLVIVGLVVDTQIAVMVLKGDGVLLDQLAVGIPFKGLLVQLARHIPRL